MNVRSVTLVAACVVFAVAFAGGSASQAQMRSAHLVFPAEGETVDGSNVTFRVDSSGIKLPEEHFHLLIDGAALDYVPGNPVPLGRADMVHFRAATTTVRMTPGPHFVVLVATDANHAPLKPWVGDSRYFFVK